MAVAMSRVPLLAVESSARLALAALSTLNPDAIRRAVFHEQVEVFNRVPGIGKKTDFPRNSTPCPTVPQETLKPNQVGYAPVAALNAWTHRIAVFPKR